MIEESALVIDVKEGFVLLQTQRKSACQSCSVKSACGTSSLAKVVGKRSSQFSVEKTFDVEIGDTVVVAIDENALVQGSLLIYFFPLVFILVIGMLADILFADELITIFSVVIGFMVSMLLVRFVFSGSRLKNTIQPHLIRRV